MARKSQSLLGKKPKIKVRASKRSLGASEPTFTDGQSLGIVAATEMYNFYNATYEQSDFQKWAVTWASKNGYTKDDVSRLRAASKSLVQPTLGAICRMSDRGLILNDDQKSYAHARIRSLIETVEPKNEVTSIATRKSPAEILKENISKFLGELESMLDDWKSNTSFNLYEKLTAMEAAGSYAKAIIQHYKPVADELKELVAGKSPDLNEAYAYMSKTDRRRSYDFIDTWIKDAEMYLSGKKAVRKTRVAKKPSTDKMLNGLKYLQESIEHKVKSIDPAKILGAKVLYLFNPKYNEIQVYHSNDDTGFSIKGTTLQNWNDTSNKKKLRANALPEILPILISSTPARAAKVFAEAKGTSNAQNGRINDNCVILRAI